MLLTKSFLLRSWSEIFFPIILSFNFIKSYLQLLKDKTFPNEKDFRTIITTTRGRE